MHGRHLEKHARVAGFIHPLPTVTGLIFRGLLRHPKKQQLKNRGIVPVIGSDFLRTCFRPVTWSVGCFYAQRILVWCTAQDVTHGLFDCRADAAAR